VALWTTQALALARFRTDPLISILLMDATGAVGLDLSFASMVILMEVQP
jgi:hypothetical protein